MHFVTNMEIGALIRTSKKFKPHLLMVLVQLGYAFQYFIAEASFKHGLNPQVYITYRNIVAGMVMLPFAYFLERSTGNVEDMHSEISTGKRKVVGNFALRLGVDVFLICCRKSRPDLTITLSVEIFVLSLLGLGMTPNMYFASLRYTSPTFIACIYNTIACLTFLLAIILRLEVLDLRSPRGISKVVGTLVSLAGVMVMTLYKGPIMRNLRHPLIYFTRNTTSHENWLKGSILAVMSCIGWSLWYIMQAFTLKRYPAQLSLITCMNFIGAAQSAVLAVILDHKHAAWTIGFNIDLWNITYSGVVVSALVLLFQVWCTVEKGPVFVTMFNPLCTLLVATLAYFVFNEKLYMGSIVGGVIVVVGLYLLLWGKESDQKKQGKSIEQPHVIICEDGREDPKPQTIISVPKNSNQEH